MADFISIMRRYITCKQKYLFFARDMVAFLVNITIYGSLDFQEGIALKLRN
jgi:hypothetical protein